MYLCFIVNGFVFFVFILQKDLCICVYVAKCICVLCICVFIYLCICKGVVKGASWCYSWQRPHLVQPPTSSLKIDGKAENLRKTQVRQTLQFSGLVLGDGGQLSTGRVCGRLVVGVVGGREGGAVLPAWSYHRLLPPPASPAPACLPLLVLASLCAPVSQGTMPAGCPGCSEGARGVKRRWRRDNASDRARGGRGTWASLAFQRTPSPAHPACHTHLSTTIYQRWDQRSWL